MRFYKTLLIVFFVLSFMSCKKEDKSNEADFTIAFGSCNKQHLENKLWDDIVAQHPDLWIWGGDNVYADTDNMDTLRAQYNMLLNTKGYKQVLNNAEVMGTWDDHDYGLNDGGEHFTARNESQKEFLDFLGVPPDSDQRQHQGVYTSKIFKTKKGSVKVIVLDTRFFRSDLTDAEDSTKRYQPNTYGEGTILGDQQWHWLENELKTSSADFNIVVSSIQFLSDKHGFETWGNFPHEVDKLKALIVESKAKGVIILSGDRHISEFSKVDLEGLKYPLIDFTSSGLTHTYSDYTWEENPYRTGFVVFDKSFGVLEFHFKNKTVKMKMMGDNGEVFQELEQAY